MRAYMCPRSSSLRPAACQAVCWCACWCASAGEGVARQRWRMAELQRSHATCVLATYCSRLLGHARPGAVTATCIPLGAHAPWSRNCRAFNANACSEAYRLPYTSPSLSLAVWLGPLRPLLALGGTRCKAVYSPP